MALPGLMHHVKKQSNVVDPYVFTQIPLIVATEFTHHQHIYQPLERILKRNGNVYEEYKKILQLPNRVVTDTHI